MQFVERFSTKSNRIGKYKGFKTFIFKKYADFEPNVAGSTLEL